jgi:hypothetical protein
MLRTLLSRQPKPSRVKKLSLAITARSTADVSDMKKALPGKGERKARAIVHYIYAELRLAATFLQSRNATVVRRVTRVNPTMLRVHPISEGIPRKYAPSS